MPSSYPGAQDNLTNPTNGDPADASQMADAYNAIEAIEGELGTDPAGSESTVAARLTAIEGGGGPSLSVLSPSSDTYINSAAATTNYDTDAEVWCGQGWNSGTSARFTLMTFDISTLAGETVFEAMLHLYRTSTVANSATATGRRLEARSMLRAYVSSEATWNIYSTGNNWGTAGARLIGTDLGAVRHGGITPVGTTADVDSWNYVDVTALVEEAIAAVQTTLRIIVGANVDGAGSNVMTYASVDNGTASIRPKLRVVHS